MELLRRLSRTTRIRLELSPLSWWFLFWLAFAVLGNVALDYFFVGHREWERRAARPPWMASPVSKTIDALRDNARQASGLLERLQAEAENRARALEDLETQVKELEQVRRVLQLNEQDRKALESMLA